MQSISFAEHGSEDIQVMPNGLAFISSVSILWAVDILRAVEFCYWNISVILRYITFSCSVGAVKNIQTTKFNRVSFYTSCFIQKSESANCKPSSVSRQSLPELTKTDNKTDVRYRMFLHHCQSLVIRTYIVEYLSVANLLELNSFQKKYKVYSTLQNVGSHLAFAHISF